MPRTVPASPRHGRHASPAPQVTIDFHCINQILQPSVDGLLVSSFEMRVSLTKVDGSELAKKSADTWNQVSTDIAARQSRQLESWSSQMKQISETLAGQMGESWQKVAVDMGQQREQQQQQLQVWQGRATRDTVG